MYVNWISSAPRACHSHLRIPNFLWRKSNWKLWKININKSFFVVINFVKNLVIWCFIDSVALVYFFRAFLRSVISSGNVQIPTSGSEIGIFSSLFANKLHSFASSSHLASHSFDCSLCGAQRQYVEQLPRQHANVCFLQPHQMTKYTVAISMNSYYKLLIASALGTLAYTHRQNKLIILYKTDSRGFSTSHHPCEQCALFIQRRDIYVFMSVWNFLFSCFFVCNWRKNFVCFNLLVNKIIHVKRHVMWRTGRRMRGKKCQILSILHKYTNFGWRVIRNVEDNELSIRYWWSRAAAVPLDGIQQIFNIEICRLQLIQINCTEIFPIQTRNREAQAQ